MSQLEPAPLPHDPALSSRPQDKPTLRRLLFGDDGLRAGWSFALFLMLTIGLSVGSLRLAIHLHWLPMPVRSAAAHELTPRVQLIGEVLQFAGVTLAALFMSLIERRPFSRYGLSLRRSLPDFLAGLFWGLAALSALIGALLLTHAIAFNGILLHGRAAVLFGVKWALVFLFVGLFEEFFTRGYLQYTVARGVAGIVRAMDPANRHAHAIGFWVAAFLFSICGFMLGHIGNPGETLPGILAVGAAGAVFVFSLYRTGTLWWAIGMHASWDWAQSFLYGVADSGTITQGRFLSSHPTGPTLLSGGATGPEGSLLVLPTLALLAVVIHFTLPRRNYPLTPDQTPDSTLGMMPEQSAAAPDDLHSV